MKRAITKEISYFKEEETNNSKTEGLKNEEYHDPHTCPVCSQDFGAEECCPYVD